MKQPEIDFGERLESEYEQMELWEDPHVKGFTWEPEDENEE